jgi:hypothetical protein
MADHDQSSSLKQVAMCSTFTILNSSVRKMFRMRIFFRALWTRAKVSIRSTIESQSRDSLDKKKVRERATVA